MLFLRSVRLSRDRVLLVKNAYRGLASLVKVSGEAGDGLAAAGREGGDSASDGCQLPTNQKQKHKFKKGKEKQSIVTSSGSCHGDFSCTFFLKATLWLSCSVHKHTSGLCGFSSRYSLLRQPRGQVCLQSPTRTTNPAVTSVLR